MKNEHLERLLALYAAGSLSTSEKQELFAAALRDPELFAQLADEDSIRELIEMPGARSRLLESLDGERSAAPAPLTPRRPLWFAWAAGMAIVAVSAGISFVAFDRSRPGTVEVSESRPPEHKPEPKVFSPPQAEDSVKPAPRVDSPPAISSAPPPLPVMKAPLPAAPPPVEAERRPMQRVSVAAEAPAVALETDVGKLATTPFADGAAAAAPAKREESAPPTVWRRTGDGQWTRVTGDEAIDRATSLSVRHMPRASGAYAVMAGPGFTQIVQGRAGEEFDVVIPPRIIAGTDGNVLRIIIEPRQPPALRAANAMRDRSAPVSLTIRLKEK